MLKIEVEVNKEDLRRILGAIGKLKYMVRYVTKTQLPRLLSLEYRNLLLQNIFSQRHTETYDPYNTKYAMWKAQYGRAHGFWQLYGDLVKNISVYYKYNGWFVGVPGTLKDSGGKSWFGMGHQGKPKYIARYGWIMELGGDYGEGGDHPARPMFEPTIDDLIQTKAPEILDQALQSIGRVWT